MVYIYMTRRRVLKIIEPTSDELYINQILGDSVYTVRLLDHYITSDNQLVMEFEPMDGTVNDISDLVNTNWRRYYTHFGYQYNYNPKPYRVKPKCQN